MPEIKHIYDGIVIGGGPSGSALATLLARAGKDVLLLEKEESPHHKVCGEFLSKKAVDYLGKLNLNLEKLGAHYIHSLRLFDGKESISCTLPTPGWSLSRLILDETLLEKAKEAGAVVKRGYRVKDFTKKNNIWEVDSSNEPAENARDIFLSTGKHDLRNWKRDCSDAQKSHFIGFKMHYRLCPAQIEALSGHTEINFIEGGYAGLQPIEDRQANLCFLLSRESFPGGSWCTVLEWLKKQTPQLSRRLESAQELWAKPKTIYQIPYGYIAGGKFHPDLFRLGDQKAVIHSFAGDGIAMALHSAFSASEVYLRGEDSSRYNAIMNRAACSPVRNAQMLSNLVMSPSLKKAIIPAMQNFPSLMKKIYFSTRC